MRLSDYSAAKRRETIALALSIVLQDLAEPSDTLTVAKLVMKRLETSGRRELDIICQSLARHLGPILPSFATQGLPDYKGRRHWTWRPKPLAKAEPTPAEIVAAQNAERDARLAQVLPTPSTTIPDWDQ